MLLAGAAYPGCPAFASRPGVRGVRQHVRTAAEKTRRKSGRDQAVRRKKTRATPFPRPPHLGCAAPCRDQALPRRHHQVDGAARHGHGRFAGVRGVEDGGRKVTFRGGDANQAARADAPAGWRERLKSAGGGVMRCALLRTLCGQSTEEMGRLQVERRGRQARGGAWEPPLFLFCISFTFRPSRPCQRRRPHPHPARPRPRWHPTARALAGLVGRCPVGPAARRNRPGEGREREGARVREREHKEERGGRKRGPNPHTILP